MTSLAHFSIRFIGASLCVALGSSPHLDRSFACEDSPAPESRKPSNLYRTVSGRGSLIRDQRCFGGRISTLGTAISG